MFCMTNTESINSKAFADSSDVNHKQESATKIGTPKFASNYENDSGPFGSNGFMSLTPSKEMPRSQKFSETLVNAVTSPINETEAAKGKRRVELGTQLATGAAASFGAKFGTFDTVTKLGNDGFSKAAQELHSNGFISENLFKKDNSGISCLNIKSKKQLNELSNAISVYGKTNGLGDLSNMSIRQLQQLKTNGKLNAVDNQMVSLAIQSKKAQKTMKTASSFDKSFAKSVGNVGKFVLADSGEYQVYSMFSRCAKYTSGAIKATVKSGVAVGKITDKAYSKVSSSVLQSRINRATKNHDVKKAGELKRLQEKKIKKREDKIKNKGMKEQEKLIKKNSRKAKVNEVKGRIKTKLSKTAPGKAWLKVKNSKFGRSVSKVAGVIAKPFKIFASAMNKLNIILAKIKFWVIAGVAGILVILMFFTLIGQGIAAAVGNPVAGLAAPSIEDTKLYEISEAMIKNEDEWFEKIKKDNGSGVVNCEGFVNPKNGKNVKIKKCSSKVIVFYNAAGDRVDPFYNTKSAVSVAYVYAVANNSLLTNFNNVFGRYSKSILEKSRSYKSGAVMNDGNKIGRFADDKVTECSGCDCESKKYYCDQKDSWIYKADFTGVHTKSSVVPYGTCKDDKGKNDCKGHKFYYCKGHVSMRINVQLIDLSSEYYNTMTIADDINSIPKGRMKTKEDKEMAFDMATLICEGDWKEKYHYKIPTKPDI